VSSESLVWAPHCNSAQLRARACLLATVRAFFLERGVLEVETPLLAAHPASDPHLIPFTTRFEGPGIGIPGDLFLQTSPEYAMKRLLAAGSGSIYQVCKAFRNGESGRWHNPEFTLLEWYRVGFGMPELIDEVDALLSRLADGHRQLGPAQVIGYCSVFKQHVGIDPITAPLSDFDREARSLGYPEGSEICDNDRATWLDFLFSHVVQPNLGRGGLCFVIDYPACLPSLARPHPTSEDLVERLEVFLDGVELGNGFHELADAEEQEHRFDQDLAIVASRNGQRRSKDQRLLAALRTGLPDCSGIALGLDRILMLLTGSSTIADVLAFPTSIA
jgi:lysyl-tRNA synthetase class 2